MKADEEITAMKVLDPGHSYSFENIDGPGVTILRFVKRQGKGYPEMKVRSQES
jgi:hypothetical protein